MRLINNIGHVSKVYYKSNNRLKQSQPPGFTLEHTSQWTKTIACGKTNAQILIENG